MRCCCSSSCSSPAAAPFLLRRRSAAGRGQAAPELAPAAPARTALVRVRADILDRLVNQAGEVSITRSKLENQVGTLKSSLFDFSDNLARLSRQLREVEMQAESQIASRMSISSEREFDPLEFDRFTRLQELTRMMAESVNDVASFHESLSRTVDAASADLVQQSRLTRDLQRDLMRVRMVPFSSLSERLFRVARQSAKELDKRVNLDIRGSAVEIDRSVLEQMAAPFEHLLRNAIVHGIESRERRGASGKAETGELLVQVSQQGNEVVIQFSDDGAGLDLAKIRAKARTRRPARRRRRDLRRRGGRPDFRAGLFDRRCADRTGRPRRRHGRGALRGAGAGRARGDRLRAGQGRALHDPPAADAGGDAGGADHQRRQDLCAAVDPGRTGAADEGGGAGRGAGGRLRCSSRARRWRCITCRPCWASATRVRWRSVRSPVMILKSGTDRLAVQVDDVLGNREVVIKNIGPQLSRMIGISGATVLGSGEIVLILNPVALSLHVAHHPGMQPAPRRQPTPAPAVPAGRDAVIMVVDDSLTVRKVTQRLLEREGYRVILAKDGVDALEHLQETIPDLMLVDIEMPRMDGFDLTRNIRGNDSTHGGADHHDHLAHRRQAPQLRARPGRECLLRQAVPGRHAAGGDRRPAQSRDAGLEPCAWLRSGA